MKNAVRRLAYVLTIILSALKLMQLRYISRKEHDRILVSMEAQYELDHKLRESHPDRVMSPSPPQSEGIASHYPSVRRPPIPRRALPSTHLASARFTEVSSASSSSGMFVPRK